MAGEWYYTVNSQQVPTPVSSEQLRQLATSGQLQATDLVWKEGMETWVPASSIKGLFGGKPTSSPEQPIPRQTNEKQDQSGSRLEKAVGKIAKSAFSALNSDEKDPSKDDKDDEEAGLHPLVVLPLTFCTGGLFGLYYAYSVCTAFASRAAKRRADTAGRPLGKPRHPLSVLVLTTLTFGLYFPFWLNAILRECGAYAGKKWGSRAELTLMLIFPFYMVFVAVFRVPTRIREVQQLAKMSEASALTPPLIFLNPCMIVGLPFLGMMYQDALNQVWASAP